MTAPPEAGQSAFGDAAYPRSEYRLRLGGREWGVLHTGDVLSFAAEQRFLNERETGPPYGVVLWPAAIALAHDIVARADAFRGRRVLELGAGTGLPGIVAASLGADVVQTERQALALAVCEENGRRNGVTSITYRAGDWTAWDDGARYDWILGADVIYGESMHDPLRAIFATNLAPGGRLLLADPFRKPSLRFLEGMEAEGWTVTMSKWSVGDARAPRTVGVFEVALPGRSG